MIAWLLVISIAVVAFSGVPGLFLSRRWALGQWVAAALNIAGSGIAGTAMVLHCVHPDIARDIRMVWALPIGRFAVAVDDVGIIFLIPMFLVSALGSVYGLSYWDQRRHTGSGRKLRLCWGLLTAGMALVVLARDGILLLMAWEIMALAAFFLVSTEERKREAREAAWVYLVATHVGTLCLFGFFALLHHATGSFDLWPSRLAGLPPHLAAALFALGAVGFGLKTGIVPVHVWLPDAHASAPSHVSAIMSGVLLKTGVYGLVRVAALMPNPPVWWGATLLVAGTLSAVLGISFAAGQRDLKRLLAYSSIENVGIIVMGVGLATLGRSLGRTDWIVLGFGALLHVLNHGLFKPLLFMGAGCVVHAGHTRQMDLLGGLGRRMPRTFVLFLIGAIAISGLPPLNGFVSELILYIGLFKTVAASTGADWVGLAAPALALVGALSVASFVKLVGTVFAGAPRSSRAAHAHEANRTMLAPMWFLAGCCVLIGILPGLVLGMLDRAITDWMPSALYSANHIGDFVPTGWLSVISVVLVALILIATFTFARSPVNRSARATGTWDCGYIRPTARMQYSGSSFSQMVVELLGWALWPRSRPPRISGVFGRPASFASDVPDLVLDRGLRPALVSAERVMALARVFQRGPIQVYLLYVLGILILLLLFA